MNKELVKLLKDPSEYWGWSRERHLISKLKSLGLEPIGSGTTRIVFRKKRDSKYVIKVPSCEQGWHCNQSEVEIAKNYPTIVAKCKLFGMSSIMRYLEKNNKDWPDNFEPWRILPDELRDYYDGWQVGKHPATGQLLYYDLNQR